MNKLTIFIFIICGAVFIAALFYVGSYALDELYNNAIDIVKWGAGGK
jgi:hypothetical protein